MKRSELVDQSNAAGDEHNTSVQSVHARALSNQSSSVERKQKYYECLRNLSAPYAVGEVAPANGTRVQGTCEWILERSEYRDWLEGDASKFLQLTGIAGTGKTTMFWFLIENLESRRKHETLAGPTALTYHSCRLGCPPIEIVRGLLFRLLKENPQTFKFLQKPFDTEGTNLFRDLWQLWKILCRIVEDPGLGKVFVLIDGLDECEEGREFFSALRDQFLRLESSQNSTMKLFVTYRPRIEVAYFFKDVGSHLNFNVSIQDGRVHDFLSLFVDWKLEDLSKRQHWPVSLQDRLRDILARPDNTFLWVSIVLNQISGLRVFSVEKKLDDLPPGLHGLYVKLLEDIHVKHGLDSLSVFQWISFARRPLRFNELAIALTPIWDEHETGTTPTAYMVDKLESVLMSCQSLILVDPGDKTVQLIHVSLREFLLEQPESKYSIRYDAMNLHILETCLKFLSREEFRSIPTCLQRNIKDYRPAILKAQLQDYFLAHPFLEYAALQWPAHARAASSKLTTCALLYDFFGENAQSLNTWLQIYWAFKRPFDDSPGFTALHVAGLLGLDPLLEWLSEQDQLTVAFNINERDTTGSTALHWAARNGHIGTVRMLIDRGAIIDVTDNEGRTPLAGAATNGHGMIINVLLDRGAIIHFRTNSGATPVHLAARNGKVAVIRLFAALSGANLDASENYGRTPLSWAAMRGHRSAANILLELGAKVNSVDSQYGRTPLHWAVVGGCEAAHRQSLIDDGVDIFIDLDDEGLDDSYLDSRGYLNVVQGLYEAGAELNARDQAQSTPLHYATEMQHQDLQSLLIKLGADVDLRNAQNKSSAQLAWDRKRLDWSLYEQNQELTANLSAAGNSEVAVLRKTHNSAAGPEMIFRKTITIPEVRNMKSKKRMQQLELLHKRIQTCLLREHNLLQKINHPNIVSYLGYDEDPETRTYTLYLEFCNAGDLSEYEKLGDGNMEAFGPQGCISNEQGSTSEEESASGVEDAVLREGEVWSFIFLLAAAIAYCHHGLSMKSVSNLDDIEFSFEPDWPGILHRDIKPQNIALQLQSDGTRIPKLCDLGLSKELIVDTRTKMAATRGYAPPDKDWTVKSDIYSFGVFLGDKFLLGAFEKIAGQLDSENGLETRLAREQRKRLLVRLERLSEDGASELFRKHGKSLHLAVLLGESAKVHELLREPTETCLNEGWSKSRWTPLHLAAQNDNFGIVQMLLESGGDKAAEDKFGHVPYYYASNGGYEWTDIILPSTN
ncbi:ankyrin repeat-containing protein [Fusarium mexicanum]|uniref:Ankyrin repeat-containing protein n=1 Tax=Fusarium mexicanum TaxID=751941 RepID=A0A8H5JC78_9HYPO|nr:ankyrin repeat-containing protein [Fusarium mexicanum]